MNKIIRVLRVMIGAILGFIVGAALGVYVPAIAGRLIYGREFYQIGWLFGMLTIPGGAFLGAYHGALTIKNRPRLFLWTFLPLAIFFLGIQATYSTLRSMDRPRHFVLLVNGTEGKEFVGTISVDGEIHKLNGVLPAQFEYESLQIELAFALAKQNGVDEIAVEVLANGNSLSKGRKVHIGLHRHVRSFGYSDSFGGTSASWVEILPEQAEQLIKDHTMPSPPWFRP